MFFPNKMNINTQREEGERGDTASDIFVNNHMTVTDSLNSTKTVIRSYTNHCI